MKKKKVNFKITGCGDSIWGASKGEFVIEKIGLNYIDDEASPTHCEIQMFGKKTEWHQYTDTQIEKEVNSKEILDICKTLASVDLKTKWKLSWSEQGMQPEDGWSFDFGIIED